jgi:hypothetical protein
MENTNGVRYIPWSFDSNGAIKTVKRKIGSEQSTFVVWY